MESVQFIKEEEATLLKKAKQHFNYESKQCLFAIL